MKMTYHTRPIWPKLPDSRLLSSWRARDCNHFPLDNLGANPFPIYPYYWDHKIGKQETTRWKSHLKLLFSGGSIDQTEALRGEKHFLGERPPPPPPPLRPLFSRSGSGTAIDQRIQYFIVTLSSLFPVNLIRSVSNEKPKTLYFFTIFNSFANWSKLKGRLSLTRLDYVVQGWFKKRTKTANPLLGNFK